jgi:hypothetical protein
VSSLGVAYPPNRRAVAPAVMSEAAERVADRYPPGLMCMCLLTSTHHARLPPGGVQGWRACAYAQPVASPVERHQLPQGTAPLTYLLRASTCRESAVLAPTDDGAHSRCFISESFDETSHFETTMSDVQHVYRRLTGQVSCAPPVQQCSSRQEERV